MQLGLLIYKIIVMATVIASIHWRHVYFRFHTYYIPGLIVILLTDGCLCFSPGHVTDVACSIRKSDLQSSSAATNGSWPTQRFGGCKIPIIQHRWSVVTPSAISHWFRILQVSRKLKSYSAVAQFTINIWNLQWSAEFGPFPLQDISANADLLSM